MKLKKTYSSKSKIKIKATELVNFSFSCKKMTLKRTYSSKSKNKIKATELHIKNSFWQCAAQSNLLIHVVLIVNLKYINALYKLIQAPMITSIFFKRSSLLLCQKTKIL